MYLRNAAALLELALCSWALQRAAAAGFTPTTTPDLVRESLLEKCGFQPRGDTTQARAHARLQAHASRWSRAGGICLACFVAEVLHYNNAHGTSKHMLLEHGDA